MATKNNLDVGGEAPHHTELADRYRIEGAVYDLTQIIPAVKGEQSNDDWNARTMGDRLEAIKSYLKDQDADDVLDNEYTAEVEELMASAVSMSNKLEAVRRVLGIGFDDDASVAISALMQEVKRLRKASTQDKSLHGAIEELKAPY